VSSNKPIVELSEQTKDILRQLFPQASWKEAKLLLETECGDNLPFCEGSTKHSMERIRFAALKVSDGDMDKLYEAVDLAQVDWRDLLIWAGFGEDIEAHNKWMITKAI